MFRTQLTILLLLAFTSTFFGQNADCDPDSPLIRYRSRNFFNSNQVIQDVVYRDGDVGEQAMDIYLPPNSDTETNRPLVMWAHPGGFLNGSKDSDSAELWCETLAKMGFVCASIDYRKDIFGDALNPFTPAIRAPYKGIQDGRSAVRYLKANAATYGINPNDIYFAGSSAGAIIAVNVAYMSDAERPPETFGNFFRSDLGCIDCGSGALEGNNTFNGDVEATIMMWGGVADTTDIDGLTGTQTDDEPCLLLHGELDETVSPAVAPPFQDDPFFAVLAGLLFPDIFGTYPMRERLTNLGSNAPNWEARVLCGEGHTFWLDKTVEDSGNGDFGSTGLPDENFDYIVNESVDFLARARGFNLSKTNEISTLVTNTTNLDDCDSESIGTYASTAFNEYFILNPTAGHTYCWDITKGTILEGQGTDRIKVRWDSTDVAINRTGTILCYESDTNGNIFEASTHLLTIQDDDVTSPDASFTANSTGAFNEFDFTNTSSNANTSEWEFGDGNGSTMESPSHTYNSGFGDYTVQLRITNINGAISETEQVVTVEGFEVLLKANLEGAYDELTQLMRDDLREKGQIPSTNPLTDNDLENLGASVVNGVLQVTGNDAIVDWVRVELRSDASTIVQAKAALLQRDGDVVDLDGVSPIAFEGVVSGDYHLVIIHRNHVSVMSELVQIE